MRKEFKIGTSIESETEYFATEKFIIYIKKIL